MGGVLGGFASTYGITGVRQNLFGDVTIKHEVGKEGMGRTLTSSKGVACEGSVFLNKTFGRRLRWLGACRYRAPSVDFDFYRRRQGKRR